MELIAHFLFSSPFCLLSSYLQTAVKIDSSCQGFDKMLCTCPRKK